MSTEEVERVHLSGIIHDVGKIGIEDKILRKAAALTDEEYEIMKQHPTRGSTSSRRCRCSRRRRATG